jgi:hypothetical protein
MFNRKLFVIVILALIITALVVLPAAAQVITQTSTFKNVSEVITDDDFCGAGEVTITLAYDGLLHTTMFTGDHPNAGSFHGKLMVNGTATAVDGDGNVMSNDRFVKTIFHTNVNRQNFNDRFNWILNGSRADGGRHRLHLIGHFNLSASGNPVVFEKLRISCP